MKFANKHDRLFVLRKALYLRYGIEVMDKKKDELDQPILPIGLIAKLIKIPEQQLRDMIK